MGVRRVAFIGIFVVFLSISLTIPSAFAWDIFIQDQDDYNRLPQWMKDLIELPKEKSGITNTGNLQEKNKLEKYTRPTFGIDHQNNQKIIDNGFKINNQTFSINDNFHTPFKEQIVKIGENNTFEAKLFASKGLKVQEFLFGIPEVGQAHKAELGVEVWFDHDGNIIELKAIQKSNIIDENTFEATHEKTKCKSTDIEENCDAVRLSVVFLEPLKYKVMALKAIDFKNRYQITYLNEGIDISGSSLNPMNTEMIPSGNKGGGLMKVTQLSKYSPYWISEDERLFEKNQFGSFREINYQFERFHDNGDVKTRTHSEFGGILDYEKKRATQIFDANSLISETPESFTYEFPENNHRINEEMEQKMIVQEQLAQKILEEFFTQARWY